MAVGIVVLNNVLFPEEEVITFIPLDQKVDSTKKVTGNGYIPCKGLEKFKYYLSITILNDLPKGIVPTPSDCDFPEYQARMQRPYSSE